MKKDFIIIGVNSIDMSIAFYEKVLGFKLKNRQKPSDDIEIAFMLSDEFKIQFVYRGDMPEVDNSSSSLSLAFTGQNLEKKKMMLVGAGLEYDTGMVGSAKRFIRFQDPAGVNIVLYE